MIEFFFIFIIFIILCKVDIKFTLLFFLFIFFFKDNDFFKKNITDKIKIPTKEKNLPNYNSNVENILKKLEKYKKNHHTQYDKGIYYWKKFIKTLKILENDNLENYNQYFDRSFDYLKESVNHFNSLSISIKERSLINGIKFNDFTPTKRMNEVSNLSKKLYHEGYLLLYNLSLDLNKRYFKNPHINNKQIVLDHPLAHNENISSFDFFI